ncbi:MAG: hypothetical protein ABWY71_02255 [Candidatus Saccharimonadales bacterium]
MNDVDDETVRGVFGEALMDELKVIREYLEYLMPIKQKVDMIELRLDYIETDIRAIKAIAREHSIQLDGHEIRLTSLEAP